MKITLKSHSIVFILQVWTFDDIILLASVWTETRSQSHEPHVNHVFTTFARSSGTGALCASTLRITLEKS